jgi:cation-transporting ATPase 13A2
MDLPALRNSCIRKYCESNLQDGNIVMCFEFKLFKYIYDTSLENFVALKFAFKTTQETLHSHFLNGLSSDEVTFQKKVFGVCDLNIEVDGVFKLLLKEVTNPFYVFQVFSIALWYSNSYSKFATIIVVTTIISLIVSIYETRSNLLNIQRMAKYSCDVNVYRFNAAGEREQMKISSRELVPGDLLEIPEDGLALPCDIILMNGVVILNEAMLTGESTPIIKTGLPNTNNQFDPNADKKYIIYAGTKVIQKRTYNADKVLGIVESIGFNTEKGNLIRQILFPVDTEYKFQKDSVRYILFMAFLSAIGFSISIPFYIKNGFDVGMIIERGLDLVTTTVPPSLPACLGIGISYALSRLKSFGIFCINRERVNVAGRVNLICFDKTGTLTEDHLDIFGFRPIKLSQGLFVFDSFRDTLTSLCEESVGYYKEKMMTGDSSDKTREVKNLFIECIASCHSITAVDGKLIGDPIDIQMFNASGWQLSENLTNRDNYDSLISAYVRPPGEPEFTDNMVSSSNDQGTHYEVGIVKRFDFSSKLQRMSVITKNIKEPHFKIFCKGSPEKIRELCRPDTIPSNFNDILNTYTTKGLRVLAVATKSVKMDFVQCQKVHREFVESNMIFIGLLVVQNKLKPETSPSIQTLHDASYKMVMATGDNILTAISVAKECLLINGDVPIWTCELVNEGNVSQLSWNLLETFKDKEDVAEQFFEEIEKEHDYESHFLAESFEMKRKGSKHKSMIENIEEGKIEDPDAAGLYVDIDNSPMNITTSRRDKIVIAITGTTFEKIYRLRNKYVATKNESLKVYYDTFRLVLQHGYIFARMAPEHKTILVESFKQEQFTVAMCGDGANDCGALRAADVGVSLSIEEASIAAHFTSNKADISCLIKLFREGKNSLVSSIQTFKYMMIYSLIQFTSVTILNVFNSYLTDNQFLVPDLFIIFPLAILIARTSAYHKLTHHQPTGALISIPIVSSILIQTTIQIIIQYGASLLVQQQPWYKNECYLVDEAVNPCLDNTVSNNI